MLYNNKHVISKLDSVIIQFKDSETDEEFYHEFLHNHYKLKLILEL